MSAKTQGNLSGGSTAAPCGMRGTIQTRERILDALVRVLTRSGIAELSIPLVAKEAKVSVPSVYRYFPTKRDLFAALDDYPHAKTLIQDMTPI